HLDSTRWDGFVPRDDDIVVTTAYKAGTTWTQRIVAALVFGGRPLPASLGELSPWIGARFFEPIEPMLERGEAQRHRRFVTSHGWFEWEPDGWPFWSHHHHLSTWWEFRAVPNLLFVHFGDLKADPDSEMRRIAAFCEIEVDERAWPAIMASVGLDAMREEARRADPGIGLAFDGGSDRFFYKGDNGRWRSVLTDDDLAQYDAAAATLDPALRVEVHAGDSTRRRRVHLRLRADLPYRGSRLLDVAHRKQTATGGQDILEARGLQDNGPARGQETRRAVAEPTAARSDIAPLG